MKSMTGFGKAKAVNGGRELTIEVKSVNNRYLDLNIRIPRGLNYVEDTVRKAIQGVVKRGSVDVFFSYMDSGERSKKLNVDKALARAYADAAADLAGSLDLDNDYSVSALFRAQDIFTVISGEDDEQILLSLVKTCITDAVNALDSMRSIEGAAIKADLAALLLSIESGVRLIRERAPKAVEELMKRTRSRIAELLGETQVDEARLLNEAAFYTDKCDISEELQRLDSHTRQFRAVMKEDGAGRKLDFLSQELLRETNTVGSKCNDIAITEIVLAIKNDIEKIKEQIRNIE